MLGKQYLDTRKGLGIKINHERGIPLYLSQGDLDEVHLEDHLPQSLTFLSPRFQEKEDTGTSSGSRIIKI